MVKNCKLVDKQDTECIECIDCLYKEDKKNRPWIYEETLNGSFFPFSNEESEEVEKEEVITLDNYF